MDNDEIILFDSDKAAQFKTGISGWVSRDGTFWGNDERAARYNGCTHVKCDICGNKVERGYIICPECSKQKDIKTFNSMPKEKWNGKGALVSFGTDLYFWSWEEVDDYCEDNNITQDDLMLVICEPNYLPLLDSDYGCDEMAEDGELPNDVLVAIDKFNEVIKKTGPVSWREGNKAAIR